MRYAWGHPAEWQQLHTSSCIAQAGLHTIIQRFNALSSTRHRLFLPRYRVPDNKYAQINSITQEHTLLNLDHKRQAYNEIPREVT